MASSLAGMILNNYISSFQPMLSWQSDDQFNHQ